MNEELNEIYAKQKRLMEDLIVLKRVVSEKKEELKELDFQYKRIQEEIHRPNFDRISKKEIVKCFDRRLKPSEVSLIVEREGIYLPIQRVSELETEEELWIRLNNPKYDAICIIINEDRSFKVKEQE